MLRRAATLIRTSTHARPAGIRRSELRDERTAALLGVALGLAFTVCFLTGLLSHLVQDSAGWFHLPSRPAGLYRVTQGLHVATGLATIPLLLAKLWTVFPKLFEWPPVRSIAHGVERAALLPLVGGSLFLLVTGTNNIYRWRPWDFSFRAAHYATSWITVGALVVHIGAKLVTTRAALARPAAPAAPDHVDGTASGSLSRRAFLGSTAAVSGLVTLFTVGQTVAPLRGLAWLAPRRPDIGPQGIPVNRTARGAGTAAIDPDAYRLVVDGPGVPTPRTFSLAELQALPQHTATLPIACVEGWSATAVWSGVRLRDVLAAAGVEASDCTVHSLQRRGPSRTAPVHRGQVADGDTLLALRIGDEPLHPDHGFPVRLIGPNRPGVHQTKWVARIEVHR